MRGFIAALLVGVTVFLAVGCGGKSNDAAGTTTVVVTETTAADTTSTATDTTATTDTDTTDDGHDRDRRHVHRHHVHGHDTTDTATTAAGLTVGCQKVANLSVQFGKALSAAGASGSTDLEKTAKAYEAFAQQVPAEIRDAFETLAKAYAQYAVAIKGLDLEAGQVPDAATIAKLAKAAQSLNGQDLTKANTRDLGVGDEELQRDAVAAADASARGERPSDELGQAPRTSAAAPPRERLRSRARSTGARRAPCRRAGAAWRPCSGRSRNGPRYASLPTNAITPGRSSRASSSSRSALPAKSPARRSPEPGVVR